MRLRFGNISDLLEVFAFAHDERELGIGASAFIVARLDSAAVGNLTACDLWHRDLQREKGWTAGTVSGCGRVPASGGDCSRVLRSAFLAVLSANPY